MKLTKAALLTGLLLVASTYAAQLALAETVVDLFEVNKEDHSAMQIAGKATVGMKFAAESPFVAIDVSCPSWSNDIGSLTLSIYAWKNTYQESIGAKPIASETFVDFPDNAWLKLEVDSLQEGDYLWVLGDGKEQVGIWKYPKSLHPATSFSNGKETKGDYQSRVFYE